MEDRQRQIGALKHELAGYVASGNTDRAAQVRSELARLGDAPETTVDTGAPDTATPSRPAARRKH